MKGTYFIFDINNYILLLKRKNFVLNFILIDRISSFKQNMQKK